MTYFCSEVVYLPNKLRCHRTKKPALAHGVTNVDPKMGAKKTVKHPTKKLEDIENKLKVTEDKLGTIERRLRKAKACIKDYLLET